jgi:hypothetical protein
LVYALILCYYTQRDGKHQITRMFSIAQRLNLITSKVSLSFTLTLASHTFILLLLLCCQCNNISEILLRDNKYLFMFLIDHWRNRRLISSGINSDVNALRNANMRSFIVLTFNGVTSLVV